jgi:hypothetical protein
MGPNLRWAAVGFLLMVPSGGRAANLTAQDAFHHVGETATVCGTVASTNFAQRVPGKPTFLDLDKPYPNGTFTILIWGQDRARFGTPENSFLQKQVCATGQIQLYQGRPQVIIHDPDQLTSAQ